MISRPISKAEVWLAQTPEGVEKCVWDVVLAAITAVEQGRRFTAATYVVGKRESYTARVLSGWRWVTSGRCFRKRLRASEEHVLFLVGPGGGGLVQLQPASCCKAWW